MTIIEEEFAAAREVFGLGVNIPGTGYFVGGNPDARQWDVALVQASDRSNVPAYADVTDLMEDLRPQMGFKVSVELLEEAGVQVRFIAR